MAFSTRPVDINYELIAMHNIEFKAELRDPIAARQQCKVIGAQLIGTLRQTDSYFRLADGRLKRREAPGEPIEWIYYHRKDAVRPRLCNYSILTEEQATRRWGTQSLKHWLNVVKTRELWLLDNVRIHIDDVDQLGTFLEFEAIVSKERDVKECHMALQHLREVFGPTLGEAVATSYSDLMAQIVSAAAD